MWLLTKNWKITASSSKEYIWGPSEPSRKYSLIALLSSSDVEEAGTLWCFMALAVKESMNSDFLEIPQQQIQTQVFRSFFKLFYEIFFLCLCVSVDIFLEEKHFPNTSFKHLNISFK